MPCAVVDRAYVGRFCPFDFWEGLGVFTLGFHLKVPAPFFGMVRADGRSFGILDQLRWLCEDVVVLKTDWISSNGGDQASELGEVSLSKSGTELLFEVITQCCKRGSITAT